MIITEILLQFSFRSQIEFMLKVVRVFGFSTVFVSLVNVNHFHAPCRYELVSCPVTYAFFIRTWFS
jgi:hypothetical protein